MTKKRPAAAEAAPKAVVRRRIQRFAAAAAGPRAIVAPAAPEVAAREAAQLRAEAEQRAIVAVAPAAPEVPAREAAQPKAAPQPAAEPKRVPSKNSVLGKYREKAVSLLEKVEASQNEEEFRSNCRELKKHLKGEVFKEYPSERQGAKYRPECPFRKSEESSSSKTLPTKEAFLAAERKRIVDEENAKQLFLEDSQRSPGM